MDPSLLLAALPERYTLAAALLVIACKIVTVFVQPPPASSRWARVYEIVSAVALNIGWAANRLTPGVTGVSVPREEADKAKAVLASANVPLVTKRPPT
ncbi:hypothetical protein [Brytella acorum]|uniref:Uncharacterized protein n=1 Tax=Brytella acorum TaxID=2959299 RepID=A0AA35UP29_9PROT|nr:hypothetical protein [Brytella acorum]CAI9119526.1 hypothetical protein LMG32879_000343 [Brytella acorum]